MTKTSEDVTSNEEDLLPIVAVQSDESSLLDELTMVRELLALRSNRTKSSSPMAPSPDDVANLRLRCLTDEQLREHADRLERDLEDLRNKDSEDNRADEDTR